MTNLNKLVTSLELSKRLKKLGVKQESIFYWKNGKLFCCCDVTNHAVENVSFCAYTAGELGEMLKDSGWALPTYNKAYAGEEWGSGIHRAHTEADAHAVLHIHLLTSNLINVKG